MGVFALWKFTGVARLRFPPEQDSPRRGVGTDTPERMGYLPVRNAVLLGVHREAAEMCWLSLTPSAAKRSIFGVLGRETEGTLGRDAGRRDRERPRERPRRTQRETAPFPTTPQAQTGTKITLHGELILHLNPTSRGPQVVYHRIGII